MNIAICNKHLAGKSVAFSSGLDGIDAKYHGVISEVLLGEWAGNASLVLMAKDANFYSVRALMLCGDIMHSVQEVEGQTSQPACTEPIISGCIPLGEIMRRVIFPEEEGMNKPPKLPTIRELIEETGTFTGCKELTDKFVKDGLIRKEGKVLHVDFNISDQPGCMCGFTGAVEKLEFVTRDLKKFFEADEIVYHLPTKHISHVTMPEVEPGYTGMIDEMPGCYESDRACGTYPVIKGLEMSWVCEGKE